MKKTKKMLSFVLSMLLIVTMFPTMAFAKEEAKTWKFGELSLKAGDVLGKDTEIKNDAENREIRILSEKTNLDERNNKNRKRGCDRSGGFLESEGSYGKGQKGSGRLSA